MVQDNFIEQLQEEIKSFQLSDFDHLRITDKTNIPNPEPIIKIGEAVISLPETITALSGGSKGGKSALAAMFTAGAIATPGTIIDIPDNIHVKPNLSQFAVIHIDTEQARHRQKINMMSTLRRCGLTETPGFFLSYNIRKLEISEYRETTNAIFRAASIEFGGIFMAIIDGVADYINSVNDEAESNAIVKYLEWLSEEYHCPIITIIHTNPSGDKERGHIGSQIQRKADSVIQIKKDKGISFLEARFLRNAGDAEMPQVMFQYDPVLKYHVGCGEREDSGSLKEMARTNQLETILEKVFGGQQSHEYNEAISYIMEVSGRAIATAKTLFKALNEGQRIIRSEDKRWRKNYAI